MSKTSSSTPKKRKKKSPKNYRQTVISGLIILALIAFVLPDLMRFFNPPTYSPAPSPTTSNPNQPINPTTMPPEPVFTKEGELSILSGKDDSAIKSIDIEIADNDEQRALGMMFRKSMKDEQGMLFLFERSEPQSFWMRNTLIPLDIIFVDKDKKITTIHRDTQPKSDVSRPSDGDAQYVLEVNGGWCQRHGVNVGDVLQW